jgi:predicted nuclease with TOPRIM domain
MMVRATMSEVDLSESILQDLKDLLESQNDNRELMQGLMARIDELEIRTDELEARVNSIETEIRMIRFEIAMVDLKLVAAPEIKST